MQKKKTRICDMLILFNLYLTDKTMKKNISNVFTDQLNCIL